MGSWSTGKGDFMPNALWADFVGVHHFLKFETPEGSDRENTMFISERCNDGSMVVGRALPREANKKKARLEHGRFLCNSSRVSDAKYQMCFIAFKSIVHVWLMNVLEE